MEKAKKSILDMTKEEIRANVVAYKMGAVDNMVLELHSDGIVNFSKFCEKYLQRTKDWTAGKLEACTYLKKDDAFTPEEYTAISAGLRDLAARLAAYANEIDSAKDE